MKTKLFTLFATMAATLGLQAFTIDFNGLVVPRLTTVDASTPLVINVAGYGDVRFEVGAASPDVLVVDTNHSNDGGSTFQNSLELDPGETVLVTFLGPQAINVDFDIIGINNGESATPVPFGSSEHQLEAIGGDGVGVAAISWNVVPEPSSGLLVLVGVSALMLRRRR